MPELPDVALFARILEEHGVGKRIRTVEVTDARILEGVDAQTFVREMTGDRLGAVRRHGKNLFAARERGGWLLMHFGMTGALEPFGDEPPAYARVIWRFARPPHLAYVNVRMLGLVGLIEDPDRYIAEHGLGPDALDPRLNAAWFAEALGDSRRSIKAALMDQSLVAGLGNVYADEVLFQAGLRPDVPVNALDRQWREKLFHTMRRVLETAVAAGAASERYTERLPEGFLTRVRGQKGARCPKCGGELATVKIGGRTSWYCPHCQIDPRTGRP